MSFRIINAYYHTPVIELSDTLYNLGDLALTDADVLYYYNGAPAYSLLTVPEAGLTFDEALYPELYALLSTNELVYNAPPDGVPNGFLWKRVADFFKRYITFIECNEGGFTYDASSSEGSVTPAIDYLVKVTIYGGNGYEINVGIDTSEIPLEDEQTDSVTIKIGALTTELLLDGTDEGVAYFNGYNEDVLEEGLFGGTPYEIEVTRSWV